MPVHVKGYSRKGATVSSFTRHGGEVKAHDRHAPKTTKRAKAKAKPRVTKAIRKARRK